MFPVLAAALVQQAMDVNRNFIIIPRDKLPDIIQRAVLAYIRNAKPGSILQEGITEELIKILAPSATETLTADEFEAAFGDEDKSDSAQIDEPPAESTVPNNTNDNQSNCSNAVRTEFIQGSTHSN